MQFVFLILAIIGLITTIIFGFLQITVHLRRGDLKFSKRFPFVVISTEGDLSHKSEKKVRKSKSKKKSKRRILIPFFAVVVLGIVFLLISTFMVQEVVALAKKPIAVMVFKNQTGERSFDYLSEAIPNLLITNLEQSKYLSVMTWERMHDLLKAHGEEDVKAIDDELFFEMCRMEGIEAIVLGSFTKAGKIFATDVKVLDVETKKLLQSANSKGEGVASILKRQIDELSRDISRGVGISTRKIEANELRIAEGTTTSMDAYNYFLRGRDDFEKLYYYDARYFLKKAVKLDSTFAMAYLYLAWSYGNLGDTKTSREAYEKAKAFSLKTTEKERLYIDAAYISAIEQDPKKRIHILRQITKKYPKEKRVHRMLASYYRDKKMFSKAIEECNKALELDPNFGLAVNELAYIYINMGDFEKAIEYFRRYASVSPGDANPFDSMGELYLQMGLLDEAIEKFKEAIEVKADFYLSYWKIGYIYALKEDYIEAMKWVNQYIEVTPSPGIAVNGYFLKWLYHYWLGILDRSLSDLDSAAFAAKAVSDEQREVAANVMRGWTYYDSGEFELGRKSFKHWLDFNVENNPASIPYFTAYHRFYSGLLDLKEGRIDSVRYRLAEIKSNLPEIEPASKDQITFFYDLLYAELLIAVDSIEKAITVYKKAKPLVVPRYMGHEQMIIYNIPSSKDVLARAYQKKGELDKAIAEYKRLLTFEPGSKDIHLFYPKYHYRLAKLFEEKGESVKAIEQYERFLEIWKNANPDTPEVKDAQAKLAKLKVTS